MDCTPQRPRYGSSNLKRGTSMASAGNQKGECLHGETPLKLGRRTSRGAPRDDYLEPSKPGEQVDIKGVQQAAAPSGLDALVESDVEGEEENVTNVTQPHADASIVPASAGTKAGCGIEFEMNGEIYRVLDTAAFATLVAEASQQQSAVVVSSRCARAKPRRSLSELRRRRSAAQEVRATDKHATEVDASLVRKAPARNPQMLNALQRALLVVTHSDIMETDAEEECPLTVAFSGVSLAEEMRLERV